MWLKFRFKSLTMNLAPKNTVVPANIGVLLCVTISRVEPDMALCADVL